MKKGDYLLISLIALMCFVGIFLLRTLDTSTENNVKTGHAVIMTGAPLTPIARWDTVPFQRIDANNPLNLAVIAFSKAGIESVVFKISGAGYTAGDKVSRQMTLNPQTNVWEYWVTLNANEFTQNGVITVEAEVHGKDGGIRTKLNDGADDYQGLDPLNFVAVTNPTGAWQKVEAWVSPTGTAQSTNGIGNRNLPYNSVRAAATAIQTYRDSNGWGNNADGGMIYMLSGTYTNPGTSSFINTNNEWLTVRADSGLRREDVIITAYNAITNIGKVKIQGITMKNINGKVVEAGVNYGWADDCYIVGAGKWAPWDTGNTGLNGAIDFGTNSASYWTNSRAESANWVLGWGDHKIVRNLTIQDISEDVIQQHALLLVNTDISETWGRNDRTNGAPHSDIIQTGSAWDNVIFYNVRVTSDHYQALFLACFEAGAICSNTAIVNSLIQMEVSPDSRWWESYGPSDGSAAWIEGYLNHFLVWQSTIIPMITPNSQDYLHDFHLKRHTSGLGVDGASIRGNVFYAFITETDSYNAAWWSNSNNEVRDNHFISRWDSLTPGATDSTGNAGVNLNDGADFGKPLSGSRLINRITNPDVPADINGKPRPAVGATIGAFEASQPCTANSCDDGNFCNGVESCSPSGNCIPGNSPCTADSFSCTETCNEATDRCNVPNNALCEDNNLCTINDRCLATSGASGTGCAYDFAPTTTACNDGNSCTSPDMCNGAGLCQGTQIPGCVACTTFTNSWQNNPFDSQSGAFTAQFVAVANNNGTNGLVCLSNGAGAAFADYAVLVGFSENGFLNARDGSTYRADTPVQYVMGKKYNFSVDVNINTKTYDVRVTPEGGSEILLANDYQFRTEQATVTALNNWGAIADRQSMDVCGGFKIITDRGSPVCVDSDNDRYNATATGCGPVDCNDNNTAVNPGATEICNSVDDDCDGTIDEGCSSQTGLVLHLKFDDDISDGIATDSSGRGNNAKCGSVYGTTCPVYAAAGKSNGALDFDGINDKAIVVTNNNDINVNSQFSFSFWIKTRSDTATDEYQAIAVKGAENGDTPRQYSVYLNFRELQSVWSNSNSYYTINTAGANLQKDMWYHVAYVRDALNENFYLNGQLITSRLSPSQMELNPNTNLRIGGLQVYPNERFNGLIDEFRMYNTALSAPEVLALYNEFTINCIDIDQDSFSVTGGDCGPVDCDDNDANIYPGAAEICNNKDDDCDGQIDEDACQIAIDYYCDIDIDTYKSIVKTGTCYGGNCVPTGCSNTAGTDCDDNNANIHPGATEICNSVDDDCDGQIDEGYVCQAFTYYCDNDGDSYNSRNKTGTCYGAGCIPNGCVGAVGSDCNDNNSNIHPGATEICNRVDDDCDGQIDEGDACPITISYYCDYDKDVYRSKSKSGTCTGNGCVPSGCMTTAGADCNDFNPLIKPTVAEICNDKIDNNCNGYIDCADKACRRSRYC